MLRIENIKDFNLDDTVTCGQIFRFEKEVDNSYTIVLIDRVVNVKYKNNTLIVDSNNMKDLETIIKKYFDLDRDYNIINSILTKKDKSLKKIVSSCYGLKMINSYPFETAISYIISANNSVPSIKKSVDTISKIYGKKIIFRNKEYYLFPTPKELKNVSVEDFRKCSVGFRDKYIKSFVDLINNDGQYLKNLNDMNSIDAFHLLQEQPGIGPKVASCILLFAYQKFDLYPIDTWVKKTMKENYNIIGEKKIREYTNSLYKEYSAIAIQYMFHYRRNSLQK